MPIHFNEYINDSPGETRKATRTRVISVGAYGTDLWKRKRKKERESKEMNIIIRIEFHQLLLVRGYKIQVSRYFYNISRFGYLCKTG